MEPDIVLNTVRLSETDETSRETYSESDLEGSLSNPDDDSESGNTASQGADSLAQTDFQLFEALNLLKGLHILGGITNG